MNEQYKNLDHHYANKEVGYYDADRPEMLDFIPPDARHILDVGCSSGTFGQLIKRERPDAVVWGIEPNRTASELAAGRLDKVICGTFDANVPELSGQKFDCIVFNDVLEHLVNPEEVLRDSKNYLTEDGSVVASIPNVLYFPAIYSVLRNQDWKYEDSGIFDSTHLRFFTRKSIHRMFSTSGFERVESTGINTYSFWKFNLLNYLILNRFSDCRYLQFAIVAKRT